VLAQRLPGREGEREIGVEKMSPEIMYTPLRKKRATYLGDADAG